MNPIRQRLNDGDPSIGTWFNLQCPFAAEQFGSAGFDWVILDLQHRFVHWSNLVPLMQALQLGGTLSLVRVPRHDPADIMGVLDLGAIGVVVPLVSTRRRPRWSATRFAIRRTATAAGGRTAPCSAPTRSTMTPSAW